MSDNSSLGSKTYFLKNGGYLLPAGSTGVEEHQESIPTEFRLKQNYPNPFNPSTTIEYQIPGDHLVILKIYDMIGKEVATLVNEYKTSGTHLVSFDASYLASGVYLYQLRAGTLTATKKMLFAK